MQQYRIKKQTMSSDGQPTFVSHGVVILTDDARGADRYVELKRQGYALERLRSSEAESQ